MVLPLNQRQRRISFFDLEEKEYLGISYINDILEANIKFITNNTDVDLYSLCCISKLNCNDDCPKYIVLCRPITDSLNLKSFLELFFKNFKLEKWHNSFRIEFFSDEDFCKCLLLSSSYFVFYSFRESNQIYRTFNVNEYEKNKSKLREYLKNNDNNHKYLTASEVNNVEVPIDYNKLIIGPLFASESEIFRILINVGEVVAFRRTHTEGYYAFIFKDSTLSKIFVEMLQKEEDVKVNYCYNMCKLLWFKNIRNFSNRLLHDPISSSCIKTKIVFLCNLEIEDDLRGILMDKCQLYGKVIKIMIPKFDLREIFENGRILGNDKVFIECDDIESAYNIYNNLGGMMYKGRVVMSGFFNEFSYFAGEYE